MVMEIIDKNLGRNYEVYKIDTVEYDGSVCYWCWSTFDNKFLWIVHTDDIKKISSH